MRPHGGSPGGGTRRSFLGASVLARAARASETRRLHAGVSRVSITPEPGCNLAGSMTNHLALAVHDDLYVRALVLDNGVNRLALVLVDSCAVSSECISRAKAAIQREAGIAPGNVCVSATHTHSAPAAVHLFQSMPDASYVDRLTACVSDSVRQAAGRLQPASIGIGSGRALGLTFNRRFFMKPGAVLNDPFGRASDRVKTNPGVGNPDIVRAAGGIDSGVGLLAVHDRGGRPIAALASYALHYVGGAGPSHISADYFAVWEAVLASKAGVDCPPFVGMLCNGCSGNINNIDVWGTDAPHPPYRKMEIVAESLASECVRVWREMKLRNWVELDGKLDFLNLGVRLPSEAEVKAARRQLARAPQVDGQYRAVSDIYARETVQLGQAWPARIRVPVQALRVGPAAIATFPGEAFVELGLEVKSNSPFRDTFLIGLANGYHGYIPTVEDHELGGYETWRAKSSYLEVGAAPKLVASALRQIGSLKG